MLIVIILISNALIWDSLIPICFASRNIQKMGGRGSQRAVKVVQGEFHGHNKRRHDSTGSRTGLLYCPTVDHKHCKQWHCSRNVLFTCRGEFPLALALVQLLARRPEAAGRHPSRSLQSGAPRQPLGSQASNHRSRCSAATSSLSVRRFSHSGT